MRLYIAEKPSLGRAIAAVLPTPHKPAGKTHIEVGNGDIVAWSAGHILSQVAPESYDEKFKSWSLATLPIIPSSWKLEVKASTKDLFNNIKKLLKSASEVVNAGDPDREGQLLIDEILDYCGYKGPVKRLLINDINPEAVKEALENMRPNEEFTGVKNAALARSRADWMHGMNATRLYTKLAQAQGYRGVLKIGRVKTPTVALVVRRDLEIASFVPKPYTRVSVDVSLPKGHLKASWVPEDSYPGLDEEGRLGDAAEASRLKAKLTGKPANITKCETKPKKISPPLGYSLPDLQIACSKKHDMPAHVTLSVVQSLYESGIMTYPRSDCKYLPTGHQAHGKDVADNIVKFLPELAGLLPDADFSRKSPVYNGDKVEEHHAIIPTKKAKQERPLTQDEAKVFELVARRYISFFLPEHEYKQTTIELLVEGEKFTAKGRQILVPGWKIAEGNEDLSANDDKKGGADEDDEKEAAALPVVHEGYVGTCEEVILAQKMTTPPARFTEASLLAAMNNVHRYVSDPEIKKILKDTDGIGTAATQANIIKELFESGQLAKVGKKVISTDTAKALIGALPEDITLPDMTALWELKFRQIAQGEKKLDEVVGSIGTNVSNLVAAGKEKGGLAIPMTQQSESAETAKKTPANNVKKSPGGCGGSTPRASSSQSKATQTCPKCGKPMVRRTGKGKDGKAYDFFGCSGYPECRETGKVKG